MIRCNIALTTLILGSVLIWSCDVRAQIPARGQERLAQAPAAPAPPVPPTAPTPPSPPAAAQAGAPAQSQAAVNPIGSVATLQGSASSTHNNAARALTLRDAIFKGDVLQTGVDGTLGITFDDDTTFTLSPNSRIAVDDFVYQEGGANNAAEFNVIRGTVAFVASAVAKTGDMKIETPTATLGIRGTTGLVEIPQGATPGTVGPVAIKLYEDADGRVGRIEVIGRDGAQLGVLSRGATGFAIRPGAPGAPLRFTAVPLQISAQEAARDRALVQQTFSAQRLGRTINIQRRNFQQRNLQRPNLQRQPGQLPGRERQPGLQPRPGQPMLERRLGTPPGPPRPQGEQRRPPPRKGQNH
jgi:hypothetical protein